MSESYIAALLDELAGVERAAKADRVRAIKAELARCGYGVTAEPIETAEATPTVETAIARRPGRPRKVD